MKSVVIIAHNIRSIHNLGSIFRTAEGFGVEKIYLSGWTASPDKSLPHIAEKLQRQLHKTALGAEEIVPFESVELNHDFLKKLKSDGWHLVGLEQDSRAILLPNYKADKKVALLLGEEVHGIEQEWRDVCDALIEIPMFGRKESFNVSVATGIALYQIFLK